MYKQEIYDVSHLHPVRGSSHCGSCGLHQWVLEEPPLPLMVVRCPCGMRSHQLRRTRRRPCPGAMRSHQLRRTRRRLCPGAMRSHQFRRTRRRPCPGALRSHQLRRTRRRPCPGAMRSHQLPRPPWRLRIQLCLKRF